ncbi:lamin tail domain-containing protein [Patescibacteria group bacterium]|nr:lamin tail domain-containing protein [Patescibacteria group bacterium]
MAGDAFFFIGILVLFFILWATTGGPTRPISFQGPYITPITNVGQDQVGYGPPVQVGGTLALPGASLTAGERTPTSIENTSSYSGIVTVAHAATGGSGAATTDGYVQISVSSTAGKDIDLTGWQLKSAETGAVATLPTAILVMRLGTSNTLQNLVLKPGDKASVTTSASPVLASFEANKCTGYLTSQQSLYNACVNAHVNDPGFLIGTWYVYLNKSGALWKSSGDTIELLDTSGKVVDSYSY